MNDQRTTTPLLEMLNQALARELRVSVQYMLQHGMGAAWAPERDDKTIAARRARFIGTKRLYYLPGDSLKKVAITEMRHAEAITERIALLGGHPITQPDVIVPGESVDEMLANDREQERGAIALYREIIALAETLGDEPTVKLFRYILREEEGHERLFARLLTTGS